MWTVNAWVCLSKRPQAESKRERAKKTKISKYGCVLHCMECILCLCDIGSEHYILHKWTWFFNGSHVHTCSFQREPFFGMLNSFLSLSLFGWNFGSIRLYSHSRDQINRFFVFQHARSHTQPKRKRQMLSLTLTRTFAYTNRMWTTKQPIMGWY